MDDSQVPQQPGGGYGLSTKSARYGNVIIMTDADVDGAFICTRVGRSRPEAAYGLDCASNEVPHSCYSGPGDSPLFFCMGELVNTAMSNE